MTKVIFDAQLLKTMSLFESITHARLMDCFDDVHTKLLTFVVEPGNIRKALGPDAKNIKNIEQKLARRIKVVEYSPDITKFIRNMVMPNKVDTVQKGEEENVYIISSTDTNTKGLIIGRNAANLRNLENNIKRQYPELKEIKVV